MNVIAADIGSDDVVTAIWQAAKSMGLTSRWEFWGAVLLVLAFVVLKKLGIVLGPNSPILPTSPTKEPPVSPPIESDKEGKFPLKQDRPKDYL